MSCDKQLNRRELGKMALGGALGATALGWPQLSFASLPLIPNGIHLGLEVSAYATDDDMLFYKQLGMEAVALGGIKPEDQTVEGLQRIKKRWEDAGIWVSSATDDVANYLLPDIVLNGPNRDKGVEAYKNMISRVGKAGIPMIKAIMYNATASLLSGSAHPRGGSGRVFDLNSSAITGAPWRLKGAVGTINAPLFGREYSRDEIVENYTYFIRQIAAVAEEVGCLIPMNPSDPAGIPSAFGVPILFYNLEDCKKSLKIANSPNVGMTLDSSWLAGGTATGIDAAGFVRYFASQKQLFHVSCRNPGSPLPRTSETFIDAGYYDMFKIFRALVDFKFSGLVQLGHNMGMVGGLHTYQAFGFGYMRAMLQCAQRGYHV